VWGRRYSHYTGSIKLVKWDGVRGVLELEEYSGRKVSQKAGSEKKEQM